MTYLIPNPSFAKLEKAKIEIQDPVAQTVGDADG
jgi:hypothetical protein